MSRDQIEEDIGYNRTIQYRAIGRENELLTVVNFVALFCNVYYYKLQCVKLSFYKLLKR